MGLSPHVVGWSIVYFVYAHAPVSSGKRQDVTFSGVKMKLPANFFAGVFDSWIQTDVELSPRPEIISARQRLKMAASFRHAP